MAKYHGKDGTVEISAAGSVYTVIGNVTQFSYDPSPDVAESKTMSSDFTERAKGHKSYSASFSFDHDPTDAGQVILAAALQSDTSYYYRFRPLSGSGEQCFGQWIDSGASRPVSATDYGKGTVSLVSNGTITISTQ